MTVAMAHDRLTRIRRYDMQSASSEEQTYDNYAAETLGPNVGGEWESHADNGFAPDAGNYTLPFYHASSTVLIMDRHNPHQSTQVKQYRCAQSQNRRHTCEVHASTATIGCGCECVVKQHMRNLWNDWFQFGTLEYTQMGNRKKPSHQTIVNMVSEAVRCIQPAVVMRAFEACGLASKNTTYYVERLDKPLLSAVTFEHGLQEQVVEFTVVDVEELNDTIDLDFE
ncbi:unnamed protein product [Sphagnum balticum]